MALEFRPCSGLPTAPAAASPGRVPQAQTAIPDIRSAPMQRTWGPGKIVILLWGVGFQTSKATVGRILRYPKKNKSLPPQARQQPP